MKKIKRTVKNFLRIPYSKADQDDILLNRISNAPAFSKIEKTKETISLLYRGTHELHARLWPHSDVMVLHQVLVQDEYRTVTDYFKTNFPGLKKLHIIDAGANVGYSSIFFLHEFPEAAIVCIEPDEHNVQILEKNLAKLIAGKSVIIKRNALMGETGKNIRTSKDFRDGKDWSVSVEETETESSLKSVTVPQLMAEMGWEHIDILKIDIEGAERYVFAADTSMEYLQRVRAVALEIHDEYNIRSAIYDQLLKNGFVIVNFGETTFGINKQFWQQP